MSTFYSEFHMNWDLTGILHEQTCSMYKTEQGHYFLRMNCYTVKPA